MTRHFSAFAAPLLVLLLAGAGCSLTTTETPPQQQWSELTAEQRAAIRSMLTDSPNPTTVVKTYDVIAEMTPEEIRAAAPFNINVLTLGADVFPFPAVQFRNTAPDKCATEHYHGAEGLTLDLRSVPQPEDSCGFGNIVTTKEVTADEIIAWFHSPSRPKE